VDLQRCPRLLTIVDAEVVPEKEYPEGQLVAMWIGGVILLAGVAAMLAILLL
jgi:hypothetical protein